MRAVIGMLLAALAAPGAAHAGFSATVAPAVLGEQQGSGWYQLRPAGLGAVSVGDRWRVGVVVAGAAPRRVARTGFAHTRAWSRASVELSWSSDGSGPRFTVSAGPAVTLRTTRWFEPDGVVVRDVGVGARTGLALDLPIWNAWRLGFGSAASSRWSSIDVDASVGVTRSW